MRSAVDSASLLLDLFRFILYHLINLAGRDNNSGRMEFLSCVTITGSLFSYKVAFLAGRAAAAGRERRKARSWILRIVARYMHAYIYIYMRAHEAAAPYRRNALSIRLAIRFSRCVRGKKLSIMLVNRGECTLPWSVKAWSDSMSRSGHLKWICTGGFITWNNCGEEICLFKLLMLMIAVQ